MRDRFYKVKCWLRDGIRVQIFTDLLCGLVSNLKNGFPVVFAIITILIICKSHGFYDVCSKF